MTTLGKKSNFENSNSISTDLRTAIIQEVQIRPPLWDENDCHWRNQEIVNELWEEIGLIVGRPGYVVKSKWKLLRDKYNSEVNKELASVTKNTRYKSKWLFYDLMKFVEYGFDNESKDSLPKRPRELPPLESEEELCDICKNCVNKLLVVDEKPTTSANLKSQMLEEDEDSPEECVLEEVPSVFDYENYLPNIEDITISVEKSKQTAPAKHDLHPVFTPKKPPSGLKPKKEVNKKPAPMATTSSEQVIHPIPSDKKKKILTPTTSSDNFKQKDSKRSKEVNNEVQKKDAVVDYQEFRDAEMKRSPNYQFLMSLLPYLDELEHVECLEVRAKIQCIINEAYKKCLKPTTPSYYPRY